MIKFFRKIRQNLIMENKKGKYFKYAIGEIILVVVGILIALSINNWNEKRKVVQDIEETKIALKKELEQNIGIANYFLSTGYTLSEVLQVFKTTGELKKLVDIGSFYGEFGLFDTFVRELSSDNLNEFISLEKSLSIRDSEILDLAKEIKKGMKERTIWEAKATDLSLQRFKEFSDELPWFYNNDSLSNKLRSDYIKNNPFFKSKAIHYLNFQLNENVFYASEIRNNKIMLLWKLENKENKDSSIDLSDFLKKKGLQTFKTIDCNTNTDIKPEYLGFRNMFLVYNHSTKKVVLQKRDEHKQIKEEITLEPNEYTNTLFWDKEYIQQNDPCERIYTPVRNGFLIIDEQ